MSVLRASTASRLVAVINARGSPRDADRPADGVPAHRGRRPAYWWRRPRGARRRIADGSLTRSGAPIRVGSSRRTSRRRNKWKAGEGAPHLHDLHCDDARCGARAVRELAIWPESSTPFSVRDRPDRQATLRARSRAELRVPILFGSDQEGHGVVRRCSINAAFLVAPTAATAAV